MPLRPASCTAVLVIGLTACVGDNPNPIPGGNVDRGRVAIEAVGCGACHVIGGVPGARGLVAPPLTNVAQRSIIAGELPNTPENMMRWIEDPQAVEPNTAMPNLGIDDRTARDITAYLYALH